MRKLLVALLLTASPAVAQTVTVDQSACRLATRHVPAADVEYKPGRDVVNGKPVAPADISPPLQVPRNFQIVIAVDVAKKLQALGGTSTATTNPNQFGLPPGGEAKAYIGAVTVDGDRLSFNGQPLTDDLENEFAALCRGWRPGR
ncbi:hypothetical protein [Roseiterribacter gracilis]|uniref:Uncharacterized protein n=1 Tax=Roseiterribacter gracilis TaxID=2812848 RepID=A0A8S8X956_9PROT|nr:hypothetical protein TMPK1_08390 [Rhodospirillales bacterium TMPK1]